MQEAAGNVTRSQPVRQRTLAFTREEKLTLLRAARFDRVSRASGELVRRLLEVIECYGTREGEFTIQRLAGLLGRGATATRRAVRDAQLLGALAVQRRVTDEGGALPNVYRVDWCAVRSLALPPREGGGSLSEPPPSLSAGAPSESEGGSESEGAPESGGAMRGRACAGVRAVGKTTNTPRVVVEDLDLENKNHHHPPPLDPTSAQGLGQVRPSVAATGGGLEIETTGSAGLRTRMIGWPSAVERLRSAGIVDVRSLVREAQAGGLAPQDVIELADFYLANRDCWASPGALHWRIRTAQPGRPAREGWPPPTEGARRSEEHRRAARDHAARRRAEASRQSADQDERAALEAQFGRRLDALTLAEREQLARRAFLSSRGGSSSPGGAEALGRALPRGLALDGAIVRPLLLAQLRDEEVS